LVIYDFRATAFCKFLNSYNNLITTNNNFEYKNNINIKNDIPLINYLFVIYKKKNDNNPLNVIESNFKQIENIYKDLKNSSKIFKNGLPTGRIRNYSEL
jgi:hypothetical protein